MSTLASLQPARTTEWVFGWSEGALLLAIVVAVILFARWRRKSGE